MVIILYTHCRSYLTKCKTTSDIAEKRANESVLLHEYTCM